jgi:hypothetical protein
LAVTRATADDLRGWDEQVDQMIRSRELRVRETQTDALVPDRQHQRLDQYYLGVRIAGGDLTRQLASDGTVSLFGMMHTAVDLSVTPRLSVADARSAINDAVGGQSFGPDAELVVLPLSDGYHLAYFGQAATSLDIGTCSSRRTPGPVTCMCDFIEVGRNVTYGTIRRSATGRRQFRCRRQVEADRITTFDARGISPSRS